MSSGGTVLLPAIRVTPSGPRPARWAAAWIRSRTMAMLSATDMDKTINHEGHEVTRRKAEKRSLSSNLGLQRLPEDAGEVARATPHNTVRLHHGYWWRRFFRVART